MRCPKCGHVESKVLDSRQSKDGGAIRRRRQCLTCKHRFTTYEMIERADIRVRKRDGRAEPFDRRKLMAGIEKACEKRPVATAQLEQVMEDIAHDVESLHVGREIDSRDIGILVMKHLHALDEVAYVRYASVYRRFQDVGEFIDEIRSLERRSKLDATQPELFPSGVAQVK